jgi:hypothetical protein
MPIGATKFLTDKKTGGCVNGMVNSFRRRNILNNCRMVKKIHSRRAKGGATGTPPLLGDELRALLTLKREAKSPFIFVSERGAPFTVAGLAKLIFPVVIDKVFFGQIA